MCEATKEHLKGKFQDEKNSLIIYKPIKEGILKSINASCEKAKAQVKKEFADLYDI